MSDGDGGCDAGTPFGVVFILEAGLRWEGVGFQPFEQRHVQAVAQVHELRGMGVGVHHACGTGMWSFFLSREGEEEERTWELCLERESLDEAAR